MKQAWGASQAAGAEIFHPEIRNEICEHKADGKLWIDIHRQAHKLGIRSNATMLYGHIERAEHRIDHLLRLRELQDGTGGFQTFIPLAFHPENNPLGMNIPKPSGMMDLKQMAIARLMLDNFDHIKAYWQMLGIKIAQVAQSYGSDDLDGTVVHETIYHAAGSEEPQELTVSEIQRLIREAGREPVERDTLYPRSDPRAGPTLGHGQEIGVGVRFELRVRGLHPRLHKKRSVGPKTKTLIHWHWALPDER